MKRAAADEEAAALARMRGIGDDYTSKAEADVPQSAKDDKLEREFKEFRGEEGAGDNIPGRPIPVKTARSAAGRQHQAQRGGGKTRSGRAGKGGKGRRQQKAVIDLNAPDTLRYLNALERRKVGFRGPRRSVDLHPVHDAGCRLAGRCVAGRNTSSPSITRRSPRRWSRSRTA